MTEEDVTVLNNIILSERDSAIAATRKLRTNIIDDLRKLVININDVIANDFINSYAPLSLKLSSEEINHLLTYPRLIGIEAPKEGSDTISIETAMSATYVTQSFNNTYNHQGDNVGVFVGEWKGCPPQTYTTRYSKLLSSDPDADHARNVIAILRHVSPLSNIYCRCKTTTHPTNHFLKPEDIESSAHTPPIFIANHSFGYISLGYDAHDKSLDDLSFHQGITCVAAAGNEGEEEWYVRSPAHGLNVITVGNYITYSNTPPQYTIKLSSSYIDPINTHNNKPELSAPGTQISIPDFYTISGTNLNCTGTSCAAPHVSGMLANRNSHWSTPSYASFTPALAKSLILLGATDPVNGGEDKVGTGGADYYRMQHPRAYWWHTGNYNTLDAADQLPNNGILDTYLYLAAANNVQARAVLTWVTRGSWTFDHMNDQYPIGSEYSLSIYDPNGNLIASEWNHYNNYAIINFYALTSGTYRFAVKRKALRDTDYPELNMAVSVYR